MARETETSALLLAGFQKALGHELPSLLVSAQGIARVLEGNSETDPESRELLDRMAQAIQKVDALVRRLGALGRLARETPRWETLPLGELIHEVAIEVRMTKGIPPATLILASELPPIVTDRERLRQSLYQLLRNAHQAARAELSLTVRVEWAEGTRVLRLTDNGRGLPERPLESLLQPFHPANPGQGLGLFTAQVLLTSLGGSLKLARAAPSGTVVELHLPTPERPTT
jgi:signal transduction histidine kinase